MSQVIEHVRELAEVIGPRPATTDAEARAADYLEDVFRGHGLDVERQEFDAPRTDSWVVVAHTALTLGAVFLARWQPLVGLVLAFAVAVLVWLERDSRPVLSRFLPKGPSQNIIARHQPRVRRGDRVKRVVIVAHYDTAKPSLFTGPGLVRYLDLAERLTWWATLAVPVTMLFFALPFARSWKTWPWWVTFVAGAYLVVPLLVALHRELFMHATDGANDNASGVAAMLAVLDETVPAGEDAGGRTQPLRRSAAAAYDADVVVPEAVLEYRDVDGDLEPRLPLDDLAPGDLGDVGWETGPLAAAPAPRYEAPLLAAEPPYDAPPLAAEPAASWRDHLDEEPLWDEPAPAATGPATSPAIPLDLPPVRREVAPEPQRMPLSEREDAGYADVPPVDVADASPAGRVPDEDEEAAPARGRRSRAARNAAPDDEEELAEGRSLRDWLGIGRGFDVRKAGKEIASWDNLDGDDEDEFGFKAGTAGDEWDAGLETGDVAARIRRRVTESVDRALAEKEIWFVATGAKEPGAFGMRALLDAYGDDLRDAFFINIDSVGVGTVAYVNEEGRARRQRADRRLVSQAKRTAREAGLSVKSASCRGHITDATPALARRMKAMSVMAFDINGRLPYWHQNDDVVEVVAEETVAQAAAFVSALVRDL